LFIAGEWTTAESGETFDAESPATGETIGTVQHGGREDARRAIAAAKADGRWDAAYAPMRATTVDTVPADLRAAIAANRRAEKTFATLDKRNLFSLAFRTNAMKTEAGRAKKIATLVAMLARGETIVPIAARRKR